MIFALLRGLALGLVTGALSAPSGEFAPWAPGLLFATNFLPWPFVWWRKLSATALSVAVWWVTYKGAGAAGQSGANHGVGLDKTPEFWARWGAQGAALLGLGLLLLGCFRGKRRFIALPLLAAAGAAAALPFKGDGDRALYLGFMAWQGTVAALLAVLTLTKDPHSI